MRIRVLLAVDAGRRLDLRRVSELDKAFDGRPTVAFQSEAGQFLHDQLLVSREVLAFWLDFHAHHFVAAPTQIVGPTALRYRPALSHSSHRELLLGLIGVDWLEVDGCACGIPLRYGPALGRRSHRECVRDYFGVHPLALGGWACAIFDGNHGQLLPKAVNGVLAVLVESLLPSLLQLSQTLLEPSSSLFRGMQVASKEFGADLWIHALCIEGARLGILRRNGGWRSRPPLEYTARVMSGSNRRSLWQVLNRSRWTDT